MSKKRPPIDLKAFINDIADESIHIAEENLDYVSQTDPIVEWNLVQTQSGKKLFSFIVFTTESGHDVTLPLTSDNIPELINSMLDNTPDIDPVTIPRLAQDESFWAKNKRNIIIFSVLTGAFVLLAAVSALWPLFTK